MDDQNRQPYTLEILADMPAVIVRPEPGRSVGDGIGVGMRDLVDLLDTAGQPLFVVLDLREVSIELGALMRAADLSARGRTPIMHHPRVREMIFVSSHVLVRTAVAGMRTEAFGFARARQFDTMEQALDYCCEQLIPPGPARPGAAE